MVACMWGGWFCDFVAEHLVRGTVYPFQCFLDITFCNVMFRLRFHGRRISLSLLKCFVFKFVG